MTLMTKKHTCMYVDMATYICIYVHVYVYIYIYVYPVVNKDSYGKLDSLIGKSTIAYGHFQHQLHSFVTYVNQLQVNQMQARRQINYNSTIKL